ncbi:unnamed protein product [Echinostoma caproni]|uniref:Peptidase A2 domain-containing protein n=1 Tax=Echinostoma caproni TaxID=27848 RepID=A0A183AB86_9TREM|nr:unnamed protein product [Echinostoma caproni]
MSHKDGFCPPQTSRRSSPRSSFKPRRPRSSRNRTSSLLTTFKVDAAYHRQFVSVHINNHPVRLQIDTASDINIISRRIWQSLGRPTLHPTTEYATSACGGSLTLLGRVARTVTFNDKSIVGDCFVTQTHLNLIGIDWLEPLGLLNAPINSVCISILSVSESTEMSPHDATHFADVF